MNHKNTGDQGMTLEDDEIADLVEYITDLKCRLRAPHSQRTGGTPVIRLPNTSYAKP